MPGTWVGREKTRVREHGRSKISRSRSRVKARMEEGKGEDKKTIH